MECWEERSPEIAFLLNPAFCGRVIYGTINEYCRKAEDGFPVALCYLILPLVLHKQTREKIKSRTKFINWVQKNQEILIDFAERARSLVSITNEAIEFLMQTGMLILDQDGCFVVDADKNILSKTKFTDDEIKKCIQKSEHVARWFKEIGSAEMIYVMLGVRP